MPARCPRLPLARCGSSAAQVALSSMPPAISAPYIQFKTCSYSAGVICRPRQSRRRSSPAPGERDGGPARRGVVIVAKFRASGGHCGGGDGGVDLKRTPVASRAMPAGLPRTRAVTAEDIVRRASAPSKLTLTRRMPLAAMRRATSPSISVASRPARRSTRRLRRGATSKMSGRKQVAAAGEHQDTDPVADESPQSVPPDGRLSPAPGLAAAAYLHQRCGGSGYRPGYSRLSFPRRPAGVEDMQMVAMEICPRCRMARRTCVGLTCYPSMRTAALRR